MGCVGQFSAKSWFAFNSEFKLAVLHKDCSSYSRYSAEKNLLSVILTHVVDIDSKPELEESCIWFAQMDKDAYGCRGHQKFTLALTLDDGMPADLTRKALVLRRPPRAARRYGAVKNIPADKIFEPVTADSIALTAFYKSNDVLACDNGKNNSYILRFYECNGANTELDARVSAKIKKARKINLVGDTLCDIPVKNCKITMSVRAYEIVTLCLEE
jgi:alpha-mannosidase